MAIGLVLGPGQAARATWSIAAVDPETREVGVAAATCTIGIEYIQGLVPDVGVILAQATTNWSARDHGVDLLRGGSSPAEVLETITDPGFDPWRPWGSWKVRQYGVVRLDPEPAAAAATGEGVSPWSGSRSEGAVSVQGNLLRGPEVVASSFAGFHDAAPREDGCAPDLGERLMRALEAGAAAGGDARCPAEAPALTALLSVARPGEDRTSPSLSLVVPRRFGPAEVAWGLVADYEPAPDDGPATRTLRERYEDWRRRRAAELSGCPAR